MIYLKTKSEIEKMRIAGRLLAKLFVELNKIVVEGVSTKEIDCYIEKYILKNGMIPECKGYHGYKFASCISLNETVVHGVPSEKIILQDGDLVKIDVVASFDGYCADMARGFEVGVVDKVKNQINKAAQEAFWAGLTKLIPGFFLTEVAAAIQENIENNGFFVVREFTGHGIGKNMHEDPPVLNYLAKTPQIKLLPGMTLAVEPMLLEKEDSVVILKDGWTAKSAKGYLAAHYEDTIVITEEGCEILTSLQ